MTSSRGPTAPALPGPLRAYLAAPELAPVWAAARDRVERNGLAMTVILTLALSDADAEAEAFELGELATDSCDSGHGLDPDEPATALVLRALAGADGLPAPSSNAGRRTCG